MNTYLMCLNLQREGNYSFMENATQVAIAEQLNGHEEIIDAVLDVPQEAQKEVMELPVLAIRNTVLMRNVMVPLLVEHDSSLKAVEEAISKDHAMFVATQLYERLEEPDPNDLYTIGMEGIVERILKLPDGSTSILLRGQRRLQRTEYLQDTPYMRVRAEVIEDVIEPSLTLEALRRAVLA